VSLPRHGLRHGGYSHQRITGIHRTFLTADAKKAGVLTLGRKLGSAIKIDPMMLSTKGWRLRKGIESTIAARFHLSPGLVIDRR
jgi:hypothetical protein